jgi:hypothetical protein
VSPNNTYGYGRLNILAAVELAQQPGTLTVQVFDQDDAPLAGMAITVTDQLTGYPYTGVTGVDGSATFAYLLAGDYQISTAAGDQFEAPMVTIQANEVRQVEIKALPPAQDDRLLFPLIQGCRLVVGAGPCTE